MNVKTTETSYSKKRSLDMRPIQLPKNLKRDTIMKGIIGDINKQVDAIMKSGKLDIGKKLKFETDIMNLVVPETAPKELKVEFTAESYKQMRELIDVCKEEIGWHGIVRRTAPDTFLIEQILVYPQEVTGTTVKATDDYPMWLGQFNDEDFNAIRFQGHSHVNMSVSPSGVDQELYAGILAQEPEFYIFLISNKRGTNWIEIHLPEFNLIYETKDIKLITPPDEKSWADEMISKYVVKKTYVSPTTTYGYYPTITGGSRSQNARANVNDFPDLEETYAKWNDIPYGYNALYVYNHQKGCYVLK